MGAIQYAQALRVIGRMLDAQGARLVEIEEDDQALSVSWQNSAADCHSQAFGKSDQLEAMLRSAVKGRGSSPPENDSKLEPLLRTLGQDLDRKGVRLGRIREIRGFQVRLDVDGSSIDSYYSFDELETKNRDRQTPRPEATRRGRLSWWPIYPFRKRTVAANRQPVS
jgi:hypothetical protein